MHHKFTKFIVYLVVQTCLLTTVAATAQVSADEREIYSASSVLNIEGNANQMDVQTCMSTVYQTLSVLPDGHAEALKDLTLIFDTDAKRGQAGGDIMRLRCVDVTEEELVAVILHEMGHVVDTGLLQGEQGDRLEFKDGSKPVMGDDPSADFYAISWVSNSQFAVDTDENSFVSGYATTDPFEDFAETYLMYVLHGESFLKMASSDSELMEKYEFMRDRVFDGVEYRGVDLYQVGDGQDYDATLFEYDLAKFSGNSN